MSQRTKRSHISPEDPDGGNPPPSLYIVGEVKEWIVCEEDPIKGFAILVRTNITLAEKRKLDEKHDHIIVDFQSEWRSKSISERDWEDTPRARQKALVAPYIYNWNAMAYNEETGEPERLSPPRTAGPTIFDSVLDEHYDWCASIVLAGYLETGKAGGSATRFGTMRVTNTGETTVNQNQKSPIDPSPQPSEEPNLSPSKDSDPGSGTDSTGGTTKK